MEIIVEYYFEDSVAEFILPKEIGSKIEAELYVLSKCYKCNNDYVYICNLDDCEDKNGNEVFLRQYNEFTLDDFRFLTVDEYLNEMRLTKK